MSYRTAGELAQRVDVVDYGGMWRGPKLDPEPLAVLVDDTQWFVTLLSDRCH